MRRHFYEFDEELQDSDQTISSPMRQLRPRERLCTVDDTRKSRNDEHLRLPRRQFPNSAFFSDTTDDDVSQPRNGVLDCPKISKSAYNRLTLLENNNTRLHMSTGSRKSRQCSNNQWGTRHIPRLHMDTIQFPRTRSVLWDRRRLSEMPANVSLEQVLPQFIVSATALKDIYKLYEEENSVRGSGVALCYLYGDATSLRMKKVLLKGVKRKKKDARAAGTWVIPVHATADGSTFGDTQESYVATIATVQRSARDEYSDNVATKLQLKLLVSRSTSHAAQQDYQLECAAPSVLFKFSLIRNLPLLMTPLAVSLTKREFSTESGNLRSGYLTLDQTRKAVPLLKVDPLVLQQPLVGVWVYGVQIDDAWDEEIAQRQLADPLLYFACLGYLLSQSIKERVRPEKNTFLVALYPASDADGSDAVGSLPRFFECEFSELPPHTHLFPIELYSHRRSCLVGASKFSSDLELTLSAAPTSEWEAARRQANIPTTPHFKENDNMASSTAYAVDKSVSHGLLTSTDKSRCMDDDDGHGDLTSGWTITSDTIRKDRDLDLDARCQASMQSENETTNAAIPAGFGVSNIEESIATEVDNVHNATCTQAGRTTPNLLTSNKTDDAAQRDWNDNNNTSNYRSCCKTQQLLTIQHQQILENQQRQLHEMQEQIVQLRCLLNTSRNEKNDASIKNDASNNEIGDTSDASSSGIETVAGVFDVSNICDQQENGHMGSQSSIVSATSQRSGDEPLSDDSSVHTHHHDENVRDRDDRDFSLSSLGFSSISCDSAAALSSLSSSFLGEQLHERSNSQLQKETMIDAKHVKAGAHDSTPSQSLPVNTGAGDQNKRIDANNIDRQKVAFSETVTDALEGFDNSSSAPDLPIDKSNALHEEAFQQLDKKGVALDDDGELNTSGDDHAVVECLLCPDAYLKKVGGFVDHHGGCYTTPSLDFHSFCVPRIKFSCDAPECDSDDEEIRLIEQKYKRLMTA